MSDHTGIIAAGILGAVGALGMLIAMGATPQDMEQKLCGEANWKLPTCAASIERAISEVKGYKP